MSWKWIGIAAAVGAGFWLGKRYYEDRKVTATRYAPPQITQDVNEANRQRPGVDEQVIAMIPDLFSQLGGIASVGAPKKMSGTFRGCKQYP